VGKAQNFAHHLPSFAHHLPFFALLDFVEITPVEIFLVGKRGQNGANSPSCSYFVIKRKKERKKKNK
jgi:hypothetical protein